MTSNATPTLTLLAATDLSAPARQAAQRAAQLAAQLGADLTLMHAMPPGAAGELRAWLGEAVHERLREQACHTLQAQAADLQRASGVTVAWRLAERGVLDAVDEAAAADDAALVVLGARGAGFMRRMVLGTTSERLLRRTQRPLLVVRTLPHEPYRRALLAIDFSPWSAQVVALARRFAPQARLTLCHAWRVPFEEKLRFAGVDDGLIERFRHDARLRAEGELRALARQAGLAGGDWDARVVEGEASQRLVEQELACDADLVVLGKHGQSAAEDLLLGSVTKHVLAEGRSDVLVATLEGAPAAA